MCTGPLRYFVQFIKVLVSTCIPEPTPYRDRFISIYSKWAFDSVNTNRKGFLGPLTLVAPKLSRFFLLGFYILSNLWTREFHQKKLKGKIPTGEGCLGVGEIRESNLRVRETAQWVTVRTWAQISRTHIKRQIWYLPLHSNCILPWPSLEPGPPSPQPLRVPFYFPGFFGYFIL